MRKDANVTIKPRPPGSVFLEHGDIQPALNWPELHERESLAERPAAPARAA